MEPLLTNAPPDVREELERLRKENAELKQMIVPPALPKSSPTSTIPTPAEPAVPEQSMIQYVCANLGDLSVKAMLLGIVLVIYAGVPEIVSWSRYVDTGLTGRVYAAGSCGINDDPVMASVDRTIDVAAAAWPDLEDGFKMTWSGYIVLPSVDGLALEVDVEGQPKPKIDLELDGAPVTADGALPVGKTPLKVEVANLKKSMGETPSSIKLVYFVGEAGERTVVPDTWLHLDSEETPEYKGKPYLDAAPTVLTKFWLVFPWGCALAYLYGGKQEVYTCFNPDVLWGMLPCGFLFSIADVSEILAQGGIDPTTYIVLSQARLLLTAVVMKIRMGKGQTTLQWMDLMILTVMIIVFQMMPNDFVASKPKGATVKDNAMLGIVMTMAKVLLSVYAGVAQQKAMQGSSAAGKCSFIAQVTAQQVGGIPAILLALPLCCVARGTPLGVYGFWGGPDGGWDHRTWGVVFAYSVKIYLVSLCVKRFDALVKNICNAGACLLTYFWATSVSHKLPGLFIPEEDGTSRLNQAGVVKIFIILGVLMTVGTYSIGGSYVPKKAAPKKAAPKSDVEMAPTAAK
jgi:hypothetical protein